MRMGDGTGQRVGGVDAGAGRVGAPITTVEAEMARSMITTNRRGIVALLGAAVILAAMTAPAGGLYFLGPHYPERYQLPACADGAFLPWLTGNSLYPSSR